MNTLQKTGLALFIIALLLFTATLGLDNYRLTEESLTEAIGNEYHLEAITAAAREKGILGKEYGSSFQFAPAFKKVLESAQKSLNQQAKEGLPEGTSQWEYKMGSWLFKDYAFIATKKSSTGPVSGNPLLFLFLTIGLAIVGGLLYILPKFRALPGIKHNHIYHNPMTRGLTPGWRGSFLGAAIIGLLLYGVYYMNDKYFWPAATAVVALLITALVFF